MVNVILDEEQIKAVDKMKNGCILRGDVGSGKSRTALYYYYTKVCGGKLKVNGVGETVHPINPPDIYIITAVKKREKKEWEEEGARFGISVDRDNSSGGRIHVDSWNNILKYKDVTNCFFIFDEQRLVGSGAWVKAFYQIAKNNRWVLLSGTPGDVWMDYVPVFIANGFYRSRREFIDSHVVYSFYGRYPKIERYFDTGILERYRRDITVLMPVRRHTRRHIVNRFVDYDKVKYDKIVKEKWNEEEERPIKDAAELVKLLRRVVNKDKSRVFTIADIQKQKKRVIVFYHFNYELELLEDWCTADGIPFAQWNGHFHQEIPDTDEWVYLVQYVAGAEAWNCTSTDTIVFYSINYSYRITEQCRGRIDRMDTKYTDLFYFTLISKASIDLSIENAQRRKMKFNEKSFVSSGQFAHF